MVKEEKFMLNPSRFNKMLEIRNKSFRSLACSMETNQGAMPLNRSKLSEYAGKNSEISDSDLAVLAYKLGCTKKYLISEGNIGSFTKADGMLLEDFKEILVRKCDLAMIKRLIKCFNVLASCNGKYDKVFSEINDGDYMYMSILEEYRKKYYQHSERTILLMMEEPACTHEKNRREAV